MENSASDDTICRTCMSKGRKLHSILEYKSVSKLQIIEILMTTVPQLHIQPGVDKLSVVICGVCLNKLNIAYHYQQLCIQTDGRLKAMLVHDKGDAVGVHKGRLQPQKEKHVDIDTNQADILLLNETATDLLLHNADTLLPLNDSCIKVENEAEFEEFPYSSAEDIDGRFKAAAADIATARTDKNGNDKISMDSTINEELFDFDAPSTPQKISTYVQEPAIKKRKFCTSSFNVDESPNEIIMPNSTFNKEAISLLKTILENQKIDMETQKKIETKITNLETSLNENMIRDKSEAMAQNKVVRECKLLIKRVRTSLCRMIGEDEDDTMVEIATTLPLTTIDTVFDVEDNLKKKEYAEAMKIYILKLKGVPGTVDDVVRKIFSDDFLKFYNWDGRFGKRSLRQLLLIEILFDVFKVEGRVQFEKNMRKCIEMSHNRYNQKKFVLKKNSIV